MRFIDKSNTYSVFDEYIVENNLDQYLSAYINDLAITLHPWKKLGEDFEGREIKRKLADHLFYEQKGICVYCEQSLSVISPNIKLTEIAHLEHIKPKARNLYPQETFNQENLILSCNGFDCNLNPEDPEFEFCGHNKSQSYDDCLFLNPTEVDSIEDYFEYTIEGEISPSENLQETDKEKANYMINLLDLQNPTLVDMRKNTLTEIILLDEDERNELLKEQNDMLPSFYSMLKQHFL